MSIQTAPAAQAGKFRGWLIVLVLGLAVTGCGNREVPAPPAKVVFENQLFRIFDMNVPPGTTLKQSYPNGIATVVMRGGVPARTAAPDGQWSEESTASAGEVRLGASGEHGIQNTGESDFQLFALENLRPRDGTVPPPAATNPVTHTVESPGFGAFDVRLDDANSQVYHVHAQPAVTVLVAGKILSQGPESKDPAIGAAPTGLKQLDQPGQWLFVPPGEPHYVVRLGLDPAHIVEIELR